MSIRTYVITLVCICSVAIGLIGNLVIVIVRIFKQFQRKHTTAYAFLICQLALADFVFAFTIIFDIHSLLHNDAWLFGKGVCKFIKTLQSTSLSTTVGFLTLMAYERYCGLSRPLRHHWSIRKTFLIVIGIWLYFILTFIPFTLSLDVQNGSCSEYNHPSETFRKAYTMFLFITNFVLPLLCITIFHSLIVIQTRKHLRSMIGNSRHRGSSNSSNENKNESQKPKDNFEQTKCNSSKIKSSTNRIHLNRNKKAFLGCFRYLQKLFKRKKAQQISLHLLSPNINTLKKRLSLRRKTMIRNTRTYEDSKLVKMLVAVTLCFAIMTLPTQVWYIWYDFGGSNQELSPTAFKILEVFASLVYLHCCVNCIIYSAMDKRFRADVKSMLSFICGKEEDSRFHRNTTYLTTACSRRSPCSLNKFNYQNSLHSPKLSPNVSPTHSEMTTLEIETVL